MPQLRSSGRTWQVAFRACRPGRRATLADSSPQNTRYAAQTRPASVSTPAPAISTIAHHNRARAIASTMVYLLVNPASSGSPPIDSAPTKKQKAVSGIFRDSPPRSEIFRMPSR